MTNNGPFSGIGLYGLPTVDHPFTPGPVSGNTIAGNLVQGNVACRSSGVCEDDGIRLEASVGPNNTVQFNTVTLNGVVGKGGDGIRVGGVGNGVRLNAVTTNGWDGIGVGLRSPPVA